MNDTAQQATPRTPHLGALSEWASIVEVATEAKSDPGQSLKQLAQIARENIGTMESSLQSAVGHLQTSMSWSQTVVALGVTAVLTVVDPTLKAAALALSIVLTTSCGVRSAKNYINVIRFGILNRRSLLFSAAFAARSPNMHSQLHNWAAGIRDYYISWKSPVNRLTVARKILLEFHYIYMFLIQIALAIKLCLDSNMASPDQYILIGGAVLAVLEVAYFFHDSPYMSVIVVDQDMVNQP